MFFKNRFAITLGSIGDYESTQEKIKNGYVFKVNLKPYKVEKFNYVRSNAKWLFCTFHYHKWLIKAKYYWQQYLNWNSVYIV